MARSRKPPDDEDALWRAVTHGVRPLPGRELPPAKPPAADRTPPTPSPKVRQTALRAPLPVPPTLPLPPLQPGRAVGVDKRTAERLRRGRMEIEARLDLHGLTQPAAHEALNGFVLAAHRHGRRTLLVITGKGRVGEGGGVLRAQVPNWLNQAPLRERVLAVYPAQPKDGGGGALYVLLKRRRPG